MYIGIDICFPGYSSLRYDMQHRPYLYAKYLFYTGHNNNNSGIPFDVSNYLPIFVPSNLTPHLFGQVGSS